MSNKGWGGARKGAGAPVTVGDEGRRKARVISLNDKEYEKLNDTAKKKRCQRIATHTRYF